MHFLYFHVRLIGGNFKVGNLLCSERKTLTVCDFRLIPPLFWVITLRVVVIPYRRFGTTYQIHHLHLNLETNSFHK